MAEHIYKPVICVMSNYKALLKWAGTPGKVLHFPKTINFHQLLETTYLEKFVHFALISSGEIFCVKSELGNQYDATYSVHSTAQACHHQKVKVNVKNRKYILEWDTNLSLLPDVDIGRTYLGGGRDPLGVMYRLYIV